MPAKQPFDVGHHPVPQLFDQYRETGLASAGIAFDHDEPTGTHIHAVVRTPNGNDYGKHLLRQLLLRQHLLRDHGSARTGAHGGAAA
jgi:hypothetical protein